MSKSVEQIVREAEAELAESQRQLRRSMLVSDIVFGASVFVFTLSFSALILVAAYRLAVDGASK